jgi:hypothetical protein
LNSCVHSWAVTDMPLPPLPEVFGNYAIRGIVEILPPAQVSWLPTTIGWRLVALIAGLLLMRWSWRRWQYWRRNRYRAAAIVELNAILAAPASHQKKLTALSRLLKATALQAYPRNEIAPLSGPEWISWLNARGGGSVFAGGSSHLLAETVYQRQAEIDEGALTDLAAATQRWIKQHTDGRVHA